MAEQIFGKLTPQADDRYGLVVSKYHEEVTRPLMEGAIGTLTRHGVADSSIVVTWVPGAFEIPVVAAEMARSGRYSAVITIGAVIQGETDHHDYINHSVAQGIARLAIDTGVPILFGVLTCRTMEQALDRAGGKTGNKGSEAALAALETVSVLKQIVSASKDEAVGRS